MILIVAAFICFALGMFSQVRWLLLANHWYIVPMVFFLIFAIWLGTLGVIEAFPA